ncbi:MAG: hypothetical protein WCI20_15390, partial [bacterium]
MHKNLTRILTPLFDSVIRASKSNLLSVMGFWALLVLTIGAPAAAENGIVVPAAAKGGETTIRNSIDWPSFLARHDLLWKT